MNIFKNTLKSCRVAVLIGAVLLIAGCVSNNQFKYNSREKLIVGKTTQAQVFEIVGKPDSTEIKKVGSNNYTIQIGRASCRERV